MTDNPFSLFADAQLHHVSNQAQTNYRLKRRHLEPLFSRMDLQRSHRCISSWPGYSPTALLSLAGLATALGVADILYKDEGSRFGLGSFKALGGAYAVSRLAHKLRNNSSTFTVTTATDGNHGLSVAWGARTHGYRAVIFIHAQVSAGREQALLALGAEVVRIDGNYDESVRICYERARDNDWVVISDTTCGASGHNIARTVMLGYSVMLAEIRVQLPDRLPSHVFVQGGVGGLAATVCEYFRIAYADNAPRCIVVEPELAPCLFQSAINQATTAIEVNNETVMAGLSCGEVSLAAWPVLARQVADFLTIQDSLVAPTMTLLGKSPYGDPSIIAGESAVAGLAGFIAAQQNKDMMLALNLSESSRVLVIGTEGATDPFVYEQLTGRLVE